MAGAGRDAAASTTTPCRPTAARSARSAIIVTDLWRRTLRRRSQKDGTTWERITQLADDGSQRRKSFTPGQSQRFAVKHPRWEPYAGIPPVRICAGGAQQ